MSKQLPPGRPLDRTLLLAVAAAINRLTKVIDASEVGQDEAELLCAILADLRLILDINGYTIDTVTNRLRRVSQ